MSKKKAAAERSSAQAILSAFGRRRTWREWAQSSDAGNQVPKKRKTKKIKTKRERTAKSRKQNKPKKQAARKLGVRLVAMNEKKQTGKTQDQILRLFFEGVMGRQPKTDQELNEWLATPVGRAAVMFDIASVSRWGEIGRS
jgi:hypothetical protein